MRAIARVVDLMKAGDYSLFTRYWYEILYMGGSWITNPLINVIVLIDGVTLKALYGEYHPAGADGLPVNWTRPVPDLFLGESTESIEFLQKQIELYSNMSTTGVLGDVVNCGESFMVGVGPVMTSKLDTKVVGYIVWAVELQSKIESFSRSKNT